MAERAESADVLARRMSGAVVSPGDSGWDEARRAWNLEVDQRPELVAVAAGTGDVAAVLQHAAVAGLRVAPQGTGHGAPGLADLDGTILLRTTGLAGVRVDPARRSARVGAGSRWADVGVPAAEHGLVPLQGFSGGVGVAGYTLGGGLGWLARSHGLACHSVTGLEAVPPGGEAIWVDAESEPDLFWALRGGGGAGVVVTALELELFPLSEAFAGQIAWPLERAAEVVEAYRDWTRELPVELTSALRLLRFPPLPELPPQLRGQAFAIVLLVFTGEPAAAEELIAPLRALGPPAFDTLATVPAAQLSAVSGDPLDPVAGIGDSVLLDDLDVSAYLAIGGPDAETELTSVEVRHLGGALERPPAGHGAAAAIEEPYLYFATGSPTDPASAGRLREELDRARETLAARSTSRTLLSFAEREPRLSDSLDPEAAARRLELARRFDPDGLIRPNHELG